MTLDRKLRHLAELCSGLEYAHRHDVIHRDIKPADLIIDAHGGGINRAHVAGSSGNPRSDRNQSRAVVPQGRDWSRAPDIAGRRSDTKV